MTGPRKQERTNGCESAGNPAKDMTQEHYSPPQPLAGPLHRHCGERSLKVPCLYIITPSVITAPRWNIPVEEPGVRKEKASPFLASTGWGVPIKIFQKWNSYYMGM